MIHIVMCNYNAWPYIKDSVKSIQLKAFTAYMGNTNIDFFIIDNASIDKSRKYIENIGIDIKHINMKDKFKYFIMDKILLDKNIGKAKAVNMLINTNKEMHATSSFENHHLIFSLDSDISLCDNFSFNMLFTFWNKFKSQISTIVCWQEGNSLFKRNFKWSECEIDGIKYQYFIPSEGYGSGIAGGALITSFENWELVGGYDESKGIYGSNDGQLLLNLYQKTNKPICVLRNTSVYHPFEKNKDYQKWKDNAHQQHLNYGKCIEEKGFYD